MSFDNIHVKNRLIFLIVQKENFPRAVLDFYALFVIDSYVAWLAEAIVAVVAIVAIEETQWILPQITKLLAFIISTP